MNATAYNLGSIKDKIYENPNQVDVPQVPIEACQEQNRFLATVSTR